MNAAHFTSRQATPAQYSASDQITTWHGNPRASDQYAPTHHSAFIAVRGETIHRSAPLDFTPPHQRTRRCSASHQGTNTPEQHSASGHSIASQAAPFLAYMAVQDIAGHTSASEQSDSFHSRPTLGFTTRHDKARQRQLTTVLGYVTPQQGTPRLRVISGHCMSRLHPSTRQHMRTTRLHVTAHRNGPTTRLHIIAVQVNTLFIIIQGAENGKR